MDLRRRPMGVGEILDRSFQIYRKHFLTAFLLVLIFYGPMYLLSQFATLDLSGLSLLPSGDVTVEESLEWFVGDPESLPPLFVVFILLMPLYLLFVIPPSLSAHLHLTDAALNEKTVRLGDIWKRSFQRYWPAVGNTALFGLVLSAAYFAIFIVLVVIILVIAAVVGTVGSQLDFGSDPFGASAVIISLFIILYVAFILFTYAAFAFCMIRFGYYLPAVVLEKEAIGLGRSWHLTRRAFWRILAILLIVSIVYGVFSFGIYALLIAVFKLSLLGHLLTVLFLLLLAPMMLIPYAVIYYDQRVRNDGTDVEQMLEAGDDQ